MFDTLTGPFKNYVIVGLSVLLFAFAGGAYLQYKHIASLNVKVTDLEVAVANEPRNVSELNTSLAFQNAAVSKLEIDKQRSEDRFKTDLTKANNDKELLLRKLRQQKTSVSHVDCNKSGSIDDANWALNLLLEGDL